MVFRNTHTKVYGFTLAELLISLAILGVIATFTIPKVLNAQQDSKWNSITKEAAAAVSQAYQLYKLNNEVNAATDMFDFTPYLNYVRTGTTGEEIDYSPGGTTTSCGGAWCVRLHNGAAIRYWGGVANAMGGTSATNAVEFLVDPDGKVTGSSGKSVLFYLYADGKLRTAAHIEPNTCFGQPPVCQNPTGTGDPSWFRWGN